MAVAFSLPEKTVELDEGVAARLLAAARAAALHAHAPFSHFRVGAAVLMREAPENIITGANVENSSYGLTLCAERTALAAAAARGLRRLHLLAVSCIDASGASLPERSPCGACRQFIREFSDEASLVLVDRGEGLPAAAFDIERLLPYSFCFGGLQPPPRTSFT